MAYLVHGHNYFVEEGDEKYSNLVGNLGVGNLAGAVLESDNSPAGPAVFWTASPENIWRNNVAANGQGHGFWYEFKGESVKKRTIQVENNYFHDNAKLGWLILPMYTPTFPQYFRNNTYGRNKGGGVFWEIGGDAHHVRDKFVANGGEADLLWWFFQDFNMENRWIPNVKDCTFVGKAEVKSGKELAVIVHVSVHVENPCSTS